MRAEWLFSNRQIGVIEYNKSNLSDQIRWLNSSSYWAICVLVEPMP